MVSFRLSDEEYDTLRTLCQTQGARSVSHMARLAVHTLLNGDQRYLDTSVQSQIDALHGKVSLLDRAVERLAQIVRTE